MKRPGLVAGGRKTTTGRKGVRWELKHKNINQKIGLE